MQLQTKAGTEIEVSLDFDAVCDYEAKHPEWSIIREVKQFGANPRFSTMNLLVGLTTYDGDWKDWSKDGLTVTDLADIISEGLNELGFGSAEGESAQ